MTDNDDHGGDDDLVEHHPDRDNPRLHLPENRRASPWTKRVVLVIVLAVLLSVPLWIDPMTLRQLMGNGPTPGPLPSPSPIGTVP